jgi:cytochrome c-type biogenesis protein CcmH/NrfF
MKKSIFFALLFGLIIIVPMQGQTDELTTLKKQVTTLKNQNIRLEKSIKDLKANSKSQSENVAASIKEMEAKLNATNDSIELSKKMAKGGRYTALVAIKSLHHRKTMFIWGAIIGLIIIGGVSFFVFRKYKSDLKKIDAKSADRQKALEDLLNKTRNELQGLIADAKDDMDHKIKNVDKKVSDLKK